VHARVAGFVGTITLNRPDKLNALSRELTRELLRTVEEMANQPDVRLVVVRGEGRAFSAGADLKERLTMAPGEMQAHTELILQAANALAALPMPTLAAIRGHCLAGGGELALGCDLRFAAFGATFGFPEVKRGIFPGAGAVVRLPRLVGPSRAADLIFSGRTIDAEEAMRIGLIDRLVEPEALEAAVTEYAEMLSANAPLGVRAAKQAIWQGLDRSVDEALHLSAVLRRPLDDTEDYREGLEAFAERRAPRFKGA
jgi:enoyl-CoA hydratase/carnithine racemase